MAVPTRSSLLASLLGASVFCLAAFSASAQTATSAGLQPQDEASEAQALAEQEREDARRNCLRYTGTHLGPNPRVARDQDDTVRADGKKCVTASGRVYTREDLDSTGHVDLKSALRSLDTGIR